MMINKNYIQLKNPLAKKSQTTFILPNGYGVLSYMETLANSVSLHSNNIIIPILSGQNNRGGILKLSTAKFDFLEVFEETKKLSSNKITILCHCSAMLYLTEINDDNFWNRIEKVVLYSFLANPKMHLDRFKHKAKKNNVTLGELDFEDLDKFEDISIYEKIPVPIYVLHPKTVLNRLRASEKDLLELGDLKNVKVIERPEIGYEILDDPQHDLVSHIVENHLNVLL